MTPHPLMGIIDDRHLHRVDAEQRPQCLLVDHWMPGTTGLQLAYRLTRLNHSAPFIMLSIAADDIREAALTAGAVAVFSKCVSADVLIEAIQIALESRGAPNGFKATQ